MLRRDEADYNHSVSPVVLAKKREVRNEGAKGFLNLQLITGEAEARGIS
jgi:hypothetical protein